MTIALIVLSVFFVCVCIVAALDVVPAVRCWVERIGIGSLAGEQAQRAVRTVAEKWLLKTPAVPVSDQTRFTLPERLKGTYKSNKVQAWQQGALLLGVAESGNKAVIQAFLPEILTDGQWKNPVQTADYALLAYAVLRSAEDPKKIQPAMEQMYNFLKTEDTVPYDKRAAQIRFVDTVGMVCPFLMLYSKIYDCPQAKALAMRQLQEYAAFGVHEKLHLPVHSFRKDNGAPLGVYGWGRGCGWYALALSELLRLDADVSALAEPFAKALLTYQQRNGAWSRQLLAESGGESSGTAMMGYFLQVLGERTGNEQYTAAAKSAAAYMRTAVRKNGVVDYAQGDTKGIGFYSAKLTSMPAAQGFALRLLSRSH